MSAEHLPAARQAIAAWDMDAVAIEPVSVSENIAFRVDSRSGQRYVLRLHRPWYHSLEELISEQTWTAALAQAGVAVHVGRERRYAGLLEWVDGETLGTVIASSDDPAFACQRFASLGEIMAEIHNQAARWRPPPGFARHALDADGLMGERPFWGRFWESQHLHREERRRLAALRDPIHRLLTDYGTERGTYSLIHADLHPGNVVVDGLRLHVIDFDDAGFGWHPYELAVALYNHQRHDEFDAVRDALLVGYRRLRAIDDEAVSLIPLFLLIRSLASIGWIAARPELDQGARAASLMRLVDHSAAAALAPFGV